MLKLKFVRFPVFRLCLRKRERGGKRRGERGQEKEDNHKTQTELVDAIHIKVFKGELNELALSSVMCMDFNKI